MSMDLNFWRYKEGASRDHERVYEAACCEGEQLEELEPLPVEDILKSIADAFPDWAAGDNGRDFEKEDWGAFQIFTTGQAVRFDCYAMQEADMNTIMDILADYGCPLYDPQISTRFDAWTDR